MNNTNTFAFTYNSRVTSEHGAGYVEEVRAMPYGLPTRYLVLHDDGHRAYVEEQNLTGGAR